MPMVWISRAVPVGSRTLRRSSSIIVRMQDEVEASRRQVGLLPPKRKTSASLVKNVLGSSVRSRSVLT